MGERMVGRNRGNEPRGSVASTLVAGGLSVGENLRPCLSPRLLAQGKPTGSVLGEVSPHIPGPGLGMRDSPTIKSEDDTPSGVENYELKYTQVRQGHQ